MNKAPLTFDSPPSKTVNITAEKSVNIITTKNEKTVNYFKAKNDAKGKFSSECSDSV